MIVAAPQGAACKTTNLTQFSLALWQQQGFDFELLDVRRGGVRTQHGAALAGALWHDPAAWLDWKDSIAARRPVVLYCAKGHEIGQGLTATLRALGVDARYLVGGMQGWLEEGRPVVPIAPLVATNPIGASS